MYTPITWYNTPCCRPRRTCWYLFLLFYVWDILYVHNQCSVLFLLACLYSCFIGCQLWSRLEECLKHLETLYNLQPEAWWGEISSTCTWCWAPAYPNQKGHNSGPRFCSGGAHCPSTTPRACTASAATGLATSVAKASLATSRSSFQSKAHVGGTPSWPSDNTCGASDTDSTSRNANDASEASTGKGSWAGSSTKGASQSDAHRTTAPTAQSNACYATTKSNACHLDQASEIRQGGVELSF